ncbi:MAG: hypothetical protein ACRD12_00685 [Acidimicrobiales bacterium]
MTHARSVLIGTAAALVAGLVAVSPADAAVNINVGCSVGALKAAIVAANGGGGGTLALAPGCTYTLTTVDNTGSAGPNGLPVLSSPITVVGNSATIERSANLGTPEFRVLEVAASAALRADTLTIRNGFLPGGKGGGIYNGTGAQSTLTRVTMTGNLTTTIFHPVFSIGFGSAIYNHAGRVLLESVSMTGNGDVTGEGGGVANSAGEVEVRNSTFRNNQADSGGALINTGVNSTTVVRNSLFVGNRGVDAGGALDNDFMNTMSVTGSTFADNAGASGAAIFNGAFGAHGITIADSSFTGNAGVQGGGLFNFGTAVVTNSRFTTGSALEGGAIRNTHELTLTGAVLSANSGNLGGGLNNAAGATANVSNTVINANIAPLYLGSQHGLGGGVFNEGTLVLTASVVMNNTAAVSGGGVQNGGQVVLQGGSAVVANSPDNCVNTGSGTGC